MEKFWTVLEYLLAALMVIGGVNTAFQATGPATANIFSLVFNTHTALVLLGLTFTVLGLTLAYCKRRKKYKWRTACLMIIFLLMVFATVGDIVVTGFSSLNWIDSVVIGLMAGVAHVRLRVVDYEAPVKYERSL